MSCERKYLSGSKTRKLFADPNFKKEWKADSLGSSHIEPGLFNCPVSGREGGRHLYHNKVDL